MNNFCPALDGITGCFVALVHGFMGCLQALNFTLFSCFINFIFCSYILSTVLKCALHSCPILQCSCHMSVLSHSAVVREKEEQKTV